MITPQFGAREPALTAALRAKLSVGRAAFVAVTTNTLFGTQIECVAAALRALEFVSLTHFIASCAHLHRVVPLAGLSLARAINISTPLHSLRVMSWRGRNHASRNAQNRDLIGRAMGSLIRSRISVIITES